MNEKYKQIISEAYRNYKKLTHEINEKNPPGYYYGNLIAGTHHLTKDSFVQMCKLDSEFSKKWELEIIERNLKWDDKVEWVMKNTPLNWDSLNIIEELHKDTTPTKLITIKYQGNKLDIYE